MRCTGAGSQGPSSTLSIKLMPAGQARECGRDPSGLRPMGLGCARVQKGFLLSARAVPINHARITRSSSRHAFSHKCAYTLSAAPCSMALETAGGLPLQSGPLSMHTLAVTIPISIIACPQWCRDMLWQRPWVTLLMRPQPQELF